jgi:hypothetical protein
MELIAGSKRLELTLMPPNGAATNSMDLLSALKLQLPFVSIALCGSEVHFHQASMALPYFEVRTTQSKV